MQQLLQFCLFFLSPFVASFSPQVTVTAYLFTDPENTPVNDYRAILAAPEQPPDTSEHSLDEPIQFSIRFDGEPMGSIVRVSENPSFNSYVQSRQVTLEAWVKPLSAEKEGQIINKAVGMCKDDWVLAVLRDLTPHFKIANSCTGNNRFLETGNALRLGEWNHLAGVWDGDSLRLFVNGNLMLRSLYEGTPSANNIDMSIGATNHWDGKHVAFDGFIDEVRYSNIARYVRDFIPEFRLKSDNATLFLFHFDEGEGEVLFDSSPNKLKGHAENIMWSLDVPGSPQNYEQAESNPTSLIVKVVVGISIVLMLAILGWMMITKRRMRGSFGKTVPVMSNHEKSRHGSGAIEIFGEFRVQDRFGKDISSQFSPQMKQLVLLLILGQGKTHNNHAMDGISTERLTAILWPHSDAQSAKNSRGVLINKVRGVLAQVGEVRIKNQDSKWIIQFGLSVRCDYHVYQRLLDRLQDDLVEGKEANLALFLDVAGKGAFLSDSSFEWLDPVRADITNEVITTCLRFLEQERTIDPEFGLRVTEIILKWESLNEKALRFNLSFLSRLGRHGAARVIYEAFAKEYTQTVGKTFPSTFEQTLTSST